MNPQGVTPPISDLSLLLFSPYALILEGENVLEIFDGTGELAKD